MLLSREIGVELALLSHLPRVQCTLASRLVAVTPRDLSIAPHLRRVPHPLSSHLLSEEAPPHSSPEDRAVTRVHARTSSAPPGLRPEPSTVPTLMQRDVTLLYMETQP